MVILGQFQKDLSNLLKPTLKYSLNFLKVYLFIHFLDQLFAQFFPENLVSFRGGNFLKDFLKWPFLWKKNGHFGSILFNGCPLFQNDRRDIFVLLSQYPIVMTVLH